MEELELLQQVFSQRMERIREEEEKGGDRARRSSLKERLGDPQVAGTVKMVRQAMQEIPDVRKDLVESIRKEIRDGNFPMDGVKLADRILQEALLNELS